MGQKLPKHLGQKPTAMTMDVVFTQNGGDIREDAAERIHRATVNAFQKAAEAEGFDYCAGMTLRFISARAYDRRYRSSEQ